ncbi:MAG: hypothetical protein QOH49_1500 [Acidobacteriota bacterium]|jgi:hypothetical protein|nr:hypothetical protein [Acidobacteriota bacterium]
MHPRLKVAFCCLASALIFLPALVPPRGAAQNRDASVTRQAWTLDEALAALALQPRDAYLQYVVLQLARRAGRFDEIEPRVRQLIPNDAALRAERRQGVDLFSLFTGALAVQESLQLDAMRSVTPRRTPAPTVAVSNMNASNMNGNLSAPSGKRRRTTRRRGQTRPPRASGNFNANDAHIPDVIEAREPAPPASPRTQGPVQVSALAGPTIKSHPWEKMLAGRKPAISALARAVPEDFYFAEFRGLTKLLDAFDAGDLWGSHLSTQAFRDTATLDVGERLKRQLAVETDPRTRPFYDLVVEEVAVAGSDPFVREGSDVTLLFRVKQPLLFRGRMDGFIEEAAKARPDARRETGEYLGVEYVQLQTPERDISVISAYPEPGLHIRSNSLAAFRRIVEAVKGKDASGRPVRRLGDTSEFAYIRTLMPRGDAREDGFVYLSDPFVRRLVGPSLKLTERRRLLCYNQLRMIGHAALLFRTERGRAPGSLEELRDSGAAPGLFGEGELSCPDGGHYTLSADGTAGVCSHHGHALRMTPNIEAPVAQVSGEEADEYRAFVAEYNQYWRTYFDPIAFRLKVTPEELRVETIILPLIDNTAYKSLASGLGGAPEPLDALPVPRRTIFSAGLRLNKEQYIRELRTEDARRPNGSADAEDIFDYPFGIPGSRAAREKTYELLSKGLGNQVGLHVYDSRPPFELNMPSILGMLLASGTGRGGGNDLMLGFEPFLALGLVSLNAPIYVSLPVADEKVVDDYLNWSDAALSYAARNERRGRWLEFEYDFYKYKLATGEPARAFGVRFDPARVNFYWARIGGGVYIATKPFILEDIAALHAQGQSAGSAGTPTTVNEDLTGHALARIRAANWNEVLPDYNLAWAENEREACLNNLGPLASAARALTAVTDGTQAPTGEALDRATVELTEGLSGARFACPEGGVYHVSADGRQVSCSVHGTAADPRQPAAPSDQSAAGRTMRRLTDLTATLTFMDDGLHAVLVVKRR